MSTINLPALMIEAVFSAVFAVVPARLLAMDEDLEVVNGVNQRALLGTMDNVSDREASSFSTVSVTHTRMYTLLPEL